MRVLRTFGELEYLAQTMGLIWMLCQWLVIDKLLENQVILDAKREAFGEDYKFYPNGEKIAIILFLNIPKQP